MQNISLQLSWKNQFQFAGYYIAKEKNYYKKYDLNVTIKEYKNNIDVTDDLLKNKCQFAIGKSSIIVDKIKNNDILLLFATFQESPLMLLSLKRDDIKSLSDIDNKKIMILPDLLEMAELNAMLLSKLNNKILYKTVKNSFNVDDLINKKVDLISAYSSNEPYLLKEKNIPYTIFHPKDYGLNFYGDILFTSKKYEQNNKKIVQEFTKASLKGWEYAFSHINETVDLIYEKYNSLNKTKEALLFEANELKKLAYKDGIKFGNINKLKLNNIINIYTLLEIIKKQKINTDNIIYKKTNNIYLNNKQKNYLKNNIIKIGIELWKPIIYYDEKNRKPKGVFADILLEIINKYNIKVKYIHKPWSELLKDFKNNKIDILPAVYFTKNREKYSLYTSSLFNVKEFIYTKKENKKIKSFSDLNNKKLAIVKKYATIKQIKKLFKNINIIETKNLEESINLLIENKIDAIFDSQVSVESYLRDNMITGIKSISQNDIKPLPLHIVTNKDNKILHNILQKGINNISDKRIIDIKNRWLYTKIKKDNIYSKLTKIEKKYLKENKIINVCRQSNLKPLEFTILDDNNIKSAGITDDILKIIENKLNIGFENIYTKSQKESLLKLNNNICDIVSYIKKDIRLKDDIIFTNSYLKYKLAIITKTNIPYISSLKELKNKRYAKSNHYVITKDINTLYPNIKLINVNNNIEAFNKVNENKSDFALEILPIASNLISSYGLFGIHIAGYSNFSYNISMAIKKENKIFASIINKVLNSIDSNKIEKINNKWIMQTNINKTIVDYTYVYIIMTILSIVGLLLSYRQVLLHKANKNLKKVVDKKTNELKKINKILTKHSIDLEFLNQDLKHKIKSEEKKSEDMSRRLFESEKLAAISEMIGNIAHQWRQPLSMISTNSSAILFENDLGKIDEKKLIKRMELIVDSTEYLSKTIDDFSDIVKGDVNEEIFKLSEVINKCLQIVKPIFEDKNIKLIKNIDNDIEIKSYPNPLIQALINILNNAKDALIENKIENKIIFLDVFESKSYVYITIKDNAGGIDEDIINKVFEPYFTTKHKFQGTGLGLNITYRLIVNTMKSIIEVRNDSYKYNNNKYKGALFKVVIAKQKQTYKLKK